MFLWISGRASYVCWPLTAECFAAAVWLVFSEFTGFQGWLLGGSFGCIDEMGEACEQNLLQEHGDAPFCCSRRYKKRATDMTRKALWLRNHLELAFGLFERQLSSMALNLDGTSAKNSAPPIPTQAE